MAFAETTKSGKVEEDGDQYVKTIIGVCLLADSNTGLPTVEKTDAAGYATAPTNALTDYICQSCRRVKRWQAGRDLIVATFNKLKGV